MSTSNHYRRRCSSSKRPSEIGQYRLHERTSASARRHQSLRCDASSIVDISQKVVFITIVD